MKKVLFWMNEHIEQLLMSIFLVFIVCLIGANVFMRYVMKNSLEWSDELARYCFIWAVFIGIGYAIKTDTNIRIDILETVVPKFKKYLNIFQDVVLFVLFVYMIKPGYAVYLDFLKSPQASPSMSIPMQFIYISLLIGYLLGVFRIVQKYVLKIRKAKHRNQTGSKDGAAS